MMGGGEHVWGSGKRGRWASTNTFIHSLACKSFIHSLTCTLTTCASVLFSGPFLPAGWADGGATNPPRVYSPRGKGNRKCLAVEPGRPGFLFRPLALSSYKWSVRLGPASENAGSNKHPSAHNKAWRQVFCPRGACGQQPWLRRGPPVAGEG